MHRQQKGFRERMGRERKPILIGLAIVAVLGIAIYLRLWTIDYKIASDETELLRRQFDLANREAMDESAEWRHRYDEEVYRATKCIEQLDEVKQSLQFKGADAAGINEKLEMLQKENMHLLELVKSMKKELEAEKLKCSMPQI